MKSYIKLTGLRYLTLQQHYPTMIFSFVFILKLREIAQASLPNSQIVAFPACLRKRRERESVRLEVISMCSRRN